MEGLNVKYLIKPIIFGTSILLIWIYLLYLYLFFTVDNNPFLKCECPSIETLSDMVVFGFFCRLVQVSIFVGGIIAPFAIIAFTGAAIGSLISTTMQIYKYVFQHSKLTYDDFHIITSIVLFGISILFFIIVMNVIIDSWVYKLLIFSIFNNG